MKRLVTLGLLLLAGCGANNGLRPAPGNTLPPAPYGATAQPTAQELTTPSPQARPQRSDDLLRSSQERRGDVERRIRSLKALRAELKRMMADGAHGVVAECSVIEALADHARCIAPHAPPDRIAGKVGKATTGKAPASSRPTPIRTPLR